MAKKSKTKRPTILRRWTKADLKVLRTGVRNRIRAVDIAIALFRTEGAIRQKAFALDLRFRPKKKTAR